MRQLELLSLGAGVQSTVLAMLSADGTLPKLDGAIFSDTGWEPRAVYAHLDRLEAQVLRPAGIPLYRVGIGNIRADALDPTHRFASMPLFVRNRDGGDGMARRQCTSEYKLRPVREQTRTLLGAQPKANGRPGRPPTGHQARTWVGISTDEADRAAPDAAPLYAPTVYPLLDLGWSRADCTRYLTRWGWGDTPKSACIGCPFHGNAAWRDMRDNQPEDWADAVDFDRRIRQGNAKATAQGQPLRGQMYLHRSRQPLDSAPIDRVTAREWAERQGDLVELALTTWEEENPDTVRGCSPFACH